MPPAICPAHGKRGSKNSRKKYMLVHVGLTRAGPFSKELRFQSTAEHSMQSFNVFMYADSALALADVSHLRNTLTVGNKPELADTFDAAEAALRLRGPNSSVLPQTCGSNHISNANGRPTPGLSKRQCLLQILDRKPMLAPAQHRCISTNSRMLTPQVLHRSMLWDSLSLPDVPLLRQKWHMLPARWPVRRPALSSHSWPR